MDLDALVGFYQNLSPENLGRFPDFYSDDAFFKDPFNEVRGVAAIQGIFGHMFQQVAEPRFVIIERVVDRHRVMLVWDFHYRTRLLGRNRVDIMRGVSHLKFGPEGKVDYHRDYWDTAEELYMKLPGLGMLMRGLRRAFSA